MLFLKRKIKFALVLVLIFEIYACKKNIPSVDYRNESKTFAGVFEEFWNKMSVNYVYWDIDKTNWDEIYNTYKPVFENLDINNKNDVKKSVNYFRAMTKNLIDGHYVINFNFSEIRDSSLYPGKVIRHQSKAFHSPFLYSSIDSNYLDKGYLFGHYISLNKSDLYVITGSVNHEILYFYCNEFSLKQAYDAKLNNNAKVALQSFFQKLENLPTNTKGIIVDVRNNPGGDIADLSFFMGHLINSPLKFGFTRYKANNGRLDYTPWIPASVLPEKIIQNIKIPIIVLADNYSISLAEVVTMTIHSLSNGVFIGENTWGATGPLIDNYMYNDGQFDVSNFLTVYTSSAEFKYVNGISYEGVGFPPDLNIPFDKNSLMAGIDPVLEAAISQIKNHPK